MLIEKLGHTNLLKDRADSPDIAATDETEPYFSIFCLTF